MKNLLVIALWIMLQLMAGCATLPDANKSGATNEVTTEPAQLSAVAGEVSSQGPRFSCYSIQSLDLTAERLIIDCHNPKGVPDVAVHIDAASPIVISAVLDIVNVKMQFNRFPDGSAGLLDTLSETRDLINLNFKDKKVSVLVLVFLFDATDPYRLLQLTASYVTVGDDGVLGALPGTLRDIQGVVHSR